MSLVRPKRRLVLHADYLQHYRAESPSRIAPSMAGFNPQTDTDRLVLAITANLKQRFQSENDVGPYSRINTANFRG